jgi:hypothetical protein
MDAKHVLPSVLSFLVLFGLSGCAERDVPTVMAPTDASMTGSQWNSKPRASASMFISGHSLTDPLPEHLILIAQSMGTGIEWNRQSLPGSAIRIRTRGLGENEAAWGGYRTGANREGENMDVLSELRAPQTIGAPAYDVLLITEQHGLLGSLVWNDTVRYLRHYHDRFIEANPNGTTYLYAPWISLNDKSDPRRWIAYERLAAPIWQCIASRVNVALAHEGRADRIVTIPVALALAELIDRAISPEGIPGVSRMSVRDTVDALVSDDVHVSETGAYFVSLVTYSAVYRRSPVGSSFPVSISPEAALALQRFAWGFVDRFFRSYSPVSLNECRDRVVREFNSVYWSYERDIGFARDEGAVRALAKITKLRIQWRQLFGTLDSSNPFYFDPATNDQYWFREPDHGTSL